MKSWWRRPSVSRFLLGVAVGLASMATAETVSAAEGQKQVLVLYSTRRDAQIVVLGEANLPRILDEAPGTSLDYYSEYIDQARFPDAHYNEAFRNFLHLKYRDVNFDVVIAIQDTAVQFVAQNRQDLFPITPVVFFANSPVADRMANSTGIVADLDFAGTVALAAALQPELENVFVVTGAAPADKAYERIARDQLQSHHPRLHVTYLAGLTTRALESRLAALPSQSMVYYVLVDQDGAGENVHPLEYLDRVAAVASAPRRVSGVVTDASARAAVTYSAARTDAYHANARHR